MSMLMGSQAAVNEREARGYRWLWPGIAVLAAVPLQGSVAMVSPQTPPPNIAPVMVSGVFPSAPPVAPVTRHIIVRRHEINDHPRGFMQAGVSPLSLESSLTVFARGTQSATLSFDMGGRAYLFPGLQGFGVSVSPQLLGRVISTTQETPWHPSSAMRAGPQGPNVASGVGRVVTTQEPPWHPRSFFNAGVYGTQVVVEGAELRSLIVRQEQPYHPPSVLFPGPPGPDVAPPQLSLVSRFMRGTQAAALASDLTGRAWLWSALPTQPAPPPTLTPERRELFTRQEQPGHPASILVPSLSSAIVQTTGTPTFRKGTHADSLAQDMRGKAWLWHGNFDAPPPPSPAGQDRIIGAQEIPWHPSSFLSGGTANYGTSIPNVTILIWDGWAQEIPPPPVIVAQSGVRPTPVFIAPVRRDIITKQEPPFHPGSLFHPGLPPTPVFVTPELRGLITVQELPWHPSSFFDAGTPPTTFFVEPESRTLLTVMEIPWHPSSFFFTATELVAPPPPPLPIVRVTVRLTGLRSFTSGGIGF